MDASTLLLSLAGFTGVFMLGWFVGTAFTLWDMAKWEGVAFIDYLDQVLESHKKFKERG